EEEDDRDEGRGRVGALSREPGPEDPGHGHGAARRAQRGEDDRGRPGDAEQGAAAAAPRGSEGHLAMPGIVTFAEHRDGKLRRPSLEAVSEARRLTGSLAGPVTAVLVGPGTESLAAELASYGADKVHVFDDPALGAYATEPYARALAQVVAEAKPSAVLVPFTAMGKDMAPRA